jgi:archaellum component FlaD/FlaE
MGEDPGAVSARALDEENGAPDAQQPESPAQLREDIERTRQDLGDTVAALAEKTDVKARAKEKVSEVRHNVTEKKTELMGKARESSPEGASSAAVQVRTKAQENPIPTAAVAAFVGGFLFGRITKKRS